MDNSTARVIVAGSLNMDIVGRVQRHPAPGETVLGGSLAYFPGGKGANQAIAAAMAGARVDMIGSVGADAFGARLVEFLRENGVNTAGVRTRETPTGTALIVVDAAGENTIVVIPGANAELDAECAPSRGDVLVAQFETPVPTTGAFFAAGCAVGATCVLNPAPASAVPRELLTLVDVLVVNEIELGAVSGDSLADEPTVSDIQAANERLRGAGFAGCLVVTLGARGAVALVGERVIDVAGQRVDAVDTTGAGDCFVGYLAAGLAGEFDIERALTRANVAASLSVQRPGAGPSMPRYEEVDSLIGPSA